MSNHALHTALLPVLAGALALPAPAVAGPGKGVSGNMPEIQRFCDELFESGDLPWLSVGECVALNISSDAERHNFWVHRCDNWRDEGILEQFYNTYSECVHGD